MDKRIVLHTKNSNSNGSLGRLLSTPENVHSTVLKVVKDLTLQMSAHLFLVLY